KSSYAASTIVWPSASLAGRPRRPWLISVTTIPVLDSILILELRYHAVSKMCKPGPAQSPPSTARSPSPWMTSSSSAAALPVSPARSEEHTSELQSPYDLVCRLLLEKNNNNV